MAVDLEAKAATVLVASLVRQLHTKKLLGEADIAEIFGHADETLSGKQDPKLDAIWVRAQEIIAR